MQLSESVGRRIAARRANAGVAVGTADKDQLQRIKLNSRPVEQLFERYAAVDEAYDRPVLGLRIVDLICKEKAAGAGRIHRRHGRMARNIGSQPAGDQSRPEVVASAGAVADHHADGLAGIELL